MTDELTQHRIKKMIRKIATKYMKASDAIFDKAKISTFTFEQWIATLPDGAEIKKVPGALYCKTTNEMFWTGDSHDRF